MLTKLSFSQGTGSKYFFYSILFLNLSLICFTKFYPSMDGPAHLYNSNILSHLIGGNKDIAEFYSINIMPIPNWTSHIILSLFHAFLPAWLAEKMLLFLYIIGMTLSFRFLIKELNPGNISLSLLIFPFIYSFLFHLGFYNFSISFILFFFTLGFWLRHQSSFKTSHYFILSLLITFTYFSNVLTFSFLGLTVGLFILYFTYNNYIKDNDISLALKSGGNKLLGLFLASLPGLIFLAIFLTKVTFFPSDNSYGAKELIKWINDARPLIVFDYAGEEIITEQFFHILLVLLILSFFLKNKANEVKQAISFKKADVFSIPILLAFVLLFIIPNGSGAGMMSDRFSLMIYILGLVWIVSRAVQSKFNVIAIVFVLVLHFGLLFKHLNGTIKNLDKDAQTIHYAANFVSNNSIVLPINLSDNWMEPHFSNYLGVDKPIIILENYEANVGWFPTRWNTDKLPNIMLGEKNSVCGITWYSNSEAKNIRQINNVLLYGDTRKLDDQNWEELKTILTNDFKLRYRSEDNYVLLFEKL